MPRQENHEPIMDWITDSIAIGNREEAQDADLLRVHSIRSILGLIKLLEPVDASRLGVERIAVFPLADGPGNDMRIVQRAVDMLGELVRETPPVLVHCQAGRSRSAIVVAGYLMKSLRIEADEALVKVAAKREIYATPEMTRLLDWLD